MRVDVQVGIMVTDAMVFFLVREHMRHLDELEDLTSVSVL